MSDISVEDFLAHYGVRGMKWGVRKDRTPEEAAARSARNKKIIKVAAISVVAAGAAFAVYKINKSSKTKVSDLPDWKKNWDVDKMNAGINERLMSSEYKDGMEVGKTGKDKFGRPAIKRPEKTIKVSPEAKKRVNEILSDAGRKQMADIRADSQRRSREVNAELKTWYNEGNVPIKDRWYAEES